MTKWSEASKASCRAKHRMRRDITLDRHLIMAGLYKSGLTLREIGEQFGMTRERVRQILREETTVAADEGGQKLRSKTRKLEKLARQMRWGCTFAQWKHLLEVGRAQSGESPTAAFHQQRHNARRRGIEWRLTLWQWWEIWQQSGHWSERGRGFGYCMCRYGDRGAYAVNNVYIATGSDNMKHWRHRRLAEAA